MEEKMDNQEITILLKKLYEESENRIKTDAIVNRVYTEKISEETINEKVNAQMNAITIGIREINSKFTEGSKNYETTKNTIVETMTNYKQALIELSEFYDGKIEQLILRKVELEASLVGAIINEEFLFDEMPDGSREIKKEFIKYLKYFDLSNISCRNMIATDIDFRFTNLDIDPQKVFNKDLSYSRFGDNNIHKFRSFDGVKMVGSDFSETRLSVGKNEKENSEKLKEVASELGAEVK